MAVFCQCQTLKGVTYRMPQVKGLADAVLNGEAAHALRMLEGLRGEGVGDRYQDGCGSFPVLDKVRAARHERLRLAAALGASNAEIENAAEIALEHHLGMTCDPVGGLVQVPCIERNAMGAVKAINACSMAMLGSGMHMVTLDQAIETMRATGRDMQSRYKETSLGGLAVTVRQVEC